MKNIVIFALLSSLTLVSCKKNEQSIYKVEYKVQCNVDGFAFLYKGSDGQMNQLLVEGKTI